MCMIEYADDFEIEWMTRRVRRALSSSHQCCECGRRIDVGEPYLWMVQRCEDQIFKARTCQHCLVACQWLRAECGGFLAGGVFEDLTQHITEEPRGTFAELMELGRLVVGMRRRWALGDGRRMPLPRIKAACVTWDIQSPIIIATD
jgi:hypothetical protein